MQKTVTGILLMACLCMLHPATAQTKIAFISFNDLVSSMPESKKADSSLAQYRDTLGQQFEAYQQEFTEQENLLTSKDTLKYTRAQMAVKKKNLTDMLARLQGYNQEAGMLLEQKKQALLSPIQVKAEDAIQAVAKENGYSYVFEKEVLHVYPSSDDILSLVRKKLGIK